MRIKKLEWTECGQEGYWEAFGFFGCFEVWPNDDEEGSYSASLNDANCYDGFEEKDDCKTVEEAKAYCQSLLEKQVKGALKFVEQDNLGAWRRADNPPAERGHYLTKIKTSNGDFFYSVSLYIPGFRWVVLQGFHTVVEWMPIPGSEEGDLAR